MRTIALVSDDKDLRHAFAFHFQREGFIVREYANM